MEARSETTKTGLVCPVTLPTMCGGRAAGAPEAFGVKIGADVCVSGQVVALPREQPPPVHRVPKGVPTSVCKTGLCRGHSPCMFWRMHF